MRSPAATLPTLRGATWIGRVWSAGLGSCWKLKTWRRTNPIATSTPHSTQHAKQQRPRPPTNTAIERVAEEDHDAEHERQIERGHHQARDGEARERHTPPSAGDKGNEDDAGHHAAERDDLEQIALEH